MVGYKNLQQHNLNYSRLHISSACQVLGLPTDEKNTIGLVTVSTLQINKRLTSSSLPTSADVSLLKAKRRDNICVKPTDRRDYIYTHMVASNRVIGCVHTR